MNGVVRFCKRDFNAGLPYSSANEQFTYVVAIWTRLPPYTIIELNGRKDGDREDGQWLRLEVRSRLRQPSEHFGSILGVFNDALSSRMEHEETENASV